LKGAESKDPENISISNAASGSHLDTFVSRHPFLELRAIQRTTNS
jgi:hypothetical protein